jgi:hypothetical protein
VGRHGDAAAHVKTANDYRHAEFAELPSEIERARKLVRLHSDQAHYAGAGKADALGNCCDIDDRIALVASLDFDIDVGAEDVLACALLDQTIDAGKAVRRQRRAPPLDDVAVVIVLRRFDKDDFEHTSCRHKGPSYG